MRVRTLKNAHIYPARPLLRMHGIEHSTCRSADFGMVRGRLSLADERARVWPSRMPILAGRHLYAGAIVKHFGHFIVDCAQRLRACRHFQEQVDSIIFLPLVPGFRHSNPFRFFCDLFAVDLSRASFISEPTVVEELVVPDLGYVPGRPRNAWYEDELEVAVDMKRFRRRDLPRRLLVSRRNYPTSRAAGMDTVTPYLLARGYREIMPETQSLRQQISLLASADFIVFEEGSAVHLLDIMPKIEARCALLKRRGQHHLDSTIIERMNGQIVPMTSDPDSMLDQLIAGGFCGLSDGQHSAG